MLSAYFHLSITNVPILVNTRAFQADLERVVSIGEFKAPHKLHLLRVYVEHCNAHKSPIAKRAMSSPKRKNPVVPYVERFLVLEPRTLVLFKTPRFSDLHPRTQYLTFSGKCHHLKELAKPVCRCHTRSTPSINNVDVLLFGMWKSLLVIHDTYILNMLTWLPFISN